MGRDDAVSIEFVDDEVADTLNTLNIAKPKPKKINIPEPSTEEELQSIKDGVPVEQALDDQNRKIEKEAQKNEANNELDFNQKSETDNSLGQPGRGNPLNKKQEYVHPQAIDLPEAVVLPNSLREIGFNGSALVLVTVGVDGSVVGTEITQSSGNDEADQLVLAQALNVKFVLSHLAVKVDAL